MEILKTVVWIIQIFSAIAIIVLVLLQHGKGADAGATFGSGGGSGSLFGATGSSNFLSRTTAIFATIFFVTTFGLVLLVSNGRVGDAGIMSGLNGKVVASGGAVHASGTKTTINDNQKTSADAKNSANSSGVPATATPKENQIPK